MGVPATIKNSSASISTTEISIMTGSSTLTAQTTQGVVHCVIDFENSIAGDEWDVVMYEARAVGQTQLPIWKAHIRGVSDPLVLPPTFLCNGWNITLKRTAGSDRTIYWSVRQDVGDVNVSTWLASTPNALSSGRVDASVGAMAANVITSSAIATDAITSTGLATSAVTEIQSGLATAAAVAAVQADTDDIQTRLPAALVSGRMDASVGAMAANTLTASALATDAVTEIVTGVWAAISEGAETVGDTIRLIAARLFGKATVQDGDGSYTFRDKADTKNRIVMARSGTARTVSTRDGT